MELTVALSGSEDDLRFIGDLEGWLRDSDLESTKLTRIEKTAVGGEDMGLSLAVLGAILAAPAVVEGAKALITAIGSWLEQRDRATYSIAIESADGRKVTITRDASKDMKPAELQMLAEELIG